MCFDCKFFATYFVRTLYLLKSDLNMNNFTILSCALLKKHLNTEFFLVRVFLYLDWIQENTDKKNLRIWTIFTQWRFLNLDIRHFSLPLSFFRLEYFMLYHKAKFFAAFTERIFDYFRHKRADESQLIG